MKALRALSASFSAGMALGSEDEVRQRSLFTRDIEALLKFGKSGDVSGPLP